MACSDRSSVECSEDCGRTGMSGVELDAGTGCLKGEVIRASVRSVDGRLESDETETTGVVGEAKGNLFSSKITWRVI